MSKWKSNVIGTWTRRAALAGCALLAPSALCAAEPRVGSHDAFYRQLDQRAGLQQSSYQPVEQPEIPEHAPEYPASPPVEEAAPEEPKAWTFQSLFDGPDGKNCLTDNGWTIGGWTEAGYSSGPDGSFTGNGEFLDDEEWGDLHLEQQWFYIGKVADGSKGFDWGMRADLMYGVDGNDTQAFGNPPGTYDYLNGWDHGIYEWALPQLYLEFAYDKLSVKVGHFFTPIGYEVVPSNGNFFFSRQLTFYNSEPFTHTGALGTYKANDKLQILSGWVAGWDTGFQQLNNSSSYLGGFIYQIAEKTSLTYMVLSGNLGARGDGTINSVIISQGWTERFTTVHQFDAFSSNLVNGAGVPTNFATDLVAGDSIGLINYGFYTVTPKAKLGIRQELYKADGIAYNTLTYGMNLLPCPNLVV